MADEPVARSAEVSPAEARSDLGPFDVPSIATALKEVYQVGSIPLVLLFIAAVVLFVLLWRGALDALPSLVTLIGVLIAAGVVVFVVINWLAYRKWRDEVQARLENRRIEVELYVTLSRSNAEIQDSFLLNILRYVGELANRPGSTPEGRRAEVDALADSLGGLLKQFLDLRGRMQLPTLTPALPESPKAPSDPGRKTGQD